MMMNCVCQKIDLQMYYEKQGIGTSYRLPNMFRSFIYDSSPGRFDALIRRGF